MTTMIEATKTRDLGGGLILRRATPEDADRLAEFNSGIHRDEDNGEPDKRVGVWNSRPADKATPQLTAGRFYDRRGYAHW